MDHPRHSTGKAWPMICYRIFVGLLLFQASMAALLSLQGAIIRGILVFPLIGGTTWAWWFFQRTFSPLMYYVALKSLHDPESRESRERSPRPRGANEINFDRETLDESREMHSRFVNPNLVNEYVSAPRFSDYFVLGDGTNLFVWKSDYKAYGFMVPAMSVR